MRALATLFAFAIFMAPLPLTAQEIEVVPMSAGQPAPWSGLLVKEGRFAKMLRLQIDVEELTVRLQIKERLFGEAVAALQGQLAKAQVDLNRRAQPDPWYKSHWFIFVLGVVTGVGLAIGAVYGAAQLK